MKKTLVVLSSVVLFMMMSCTNKQEQKMREQHLQDSFSALLNTKTAQVETMFSQLNDIDKSLAEITDQYQSISKQTATNNEIGKDAASNIKSRVEKINQILQQNKEKINAIKSKLGKNQKENKELRAFVDNLNKRIAEQEEQIQNLTKELQKKNIQIDNLNNDVARLTNESKNKDVKISKIEDEKNVAYFIVGTKAELLSRGIINNKGGFIGLGKSTIAANNIDVSVMTKIDIRNVSEIPLTGKKIKIISSHPTTSYELEGNQKMPASLRITNSELFWRTSRCLIIMTK